MDAATRDRMYREALQQLAILRQQLANNPDLGRQVSDLYREVQGWHLSGPELEERLRRQVLPNIEQLELMLRRQLDEQKSGQVRSGASDPVPAGYADPVAEYYKKLSKGK